MEAVVPLSVLSWVVPRLGWAAWIGDFDANNLGPIVGTIAARIGCQARDALDHTDVLALAKWNIDEGPGDAGLFCYRTHDFNPQKCNSWNPVSLAVLHAVR